MAGQEGGRLIERFVAWRGGADAGFVEVTSASAGEDDPSVSLETVSHVAAAGDLSMKRLTRRGRTAGRRGNTCCAAPGRSGRGGVMGGGTMEDGRENERADASSDPPGLGYARSAKNVVFFAVAVDDRIPPVCRNKRQGITFFRAGAALN